MKILHLLSQTQLTGAEVYAAEVARQQQNLGHEIFFISDRLHISQAPEYLSLPISKSDFKSCRLIRTKLREFLLENKIQIIHCHSRAAVRHAHSARRGLPIAMVTTIHGKQHNSISKRLFDHWGEYKILICENLLPQFKDQFKISPETLKIIRNPFRLPSLKDGFKPDSKNKKIAFVGRSSGPKGERFKDFFITSLSPWLKLHPEIQLDIIAHSPENFGEEFTRLIQTHPDQVHLKSNIQDLSLILPDYALVIGAGRVAIECLLLQIPVVAFGEAHCHGFVQLENYAQVRASNFGDIAKENIEPMDKEVFLEALHRGLTASLTNQDGLRQLAEQVRNDFDINKIAPEILATYRSALLKRHYPRWIPILMYHKVPDRPLSSRHRIFVTKDRFEKHLYWFGKFGFTTLTFTDLSKAWENGDYVQLPKKPLVLTFDDGYLDNLTNALPLLQKMKMKAEIFLLADHSIVQKRLGPSKRK